LVFVRKEQSQLIHAGFYELGEQARRAVVFEAGNDAPHDLWQKVTRQSAAQNLIALPIVAEGVDALAMITTDDHPAATPVQSGSPEWGVLARTIGLAIAWSSSRSESEAMTQELLDLNRRCREAEKQLVRMRSISMVGEMAAGAAHELNNPLAVISGRAQMELELAVEPERRRAMEIVVEQAKKASQIVLDLMKFAKPDSPNAKVQPLQQVMRNALQHWKQPSLGSRELITAGSPDQT
jgi:signal transduction histidine kinase